MNRAALRRQMRQARSGLSAGQRITAAEAVAVSLEQLPEFLTDRRIAGYWASGGELPLAAVLGGLRARGQQFHLPVLGSDRLLRFAPWRMGEPVTPNRHGIPEPSSPERLLEADALDVVLVPLLAFDRTGRRLGQGGGWYDRSFAFLAGRSHQARPVLVGVGYSFQEHPGLEAMPWDVDLDYVATADELIECRPPAD